MAEDMSAAVEVEFELEDLESIPSLAVRHPDIETGRSSRLGASVLVAGDLWCPIDTALPDAPDRTPWQSVSSLVKRHDFSVVNLEAPISSALPDDAKSGPRLRSHAGTAAALRAGGFTAVSLANNHIRDCGDRGVLDTLTACSKAGLLCVGAGADRHAALSPLILEIGELRLGVMAVAEQEFSIAGSKRPGAAPLEPYSTPALVQELHRLVDAVVVLVHGGNEFYELPSPRLKSLAHSLVRCGASAVVFHHQHVYSGVEVVDGAAIVYGTGNFFFPPRFSREPRWRSGYMVSLVVSGSGVRRLRLLPYRQSDPEPAVRPLSAREASSFAADASALSTTIASDDALRLAWSRFCTGQRTRYLARLLNLSRLERAALERGVWPFWRLRRTEVPTLLNTLTCEAHRETMIDVLESEMTALRTDASREVSR